MSVPESLYAEPHALQSWEYVRKNMDYDPEKLIKSFHISVNRRFK